MAANKQVDAERAVRAWRLSRIEGRGLPDVALAVGVSDSQAEWLIRRVDAALQAQMAARYGPHEAKRLFLRLQRAARQAYLYRLAKEGLAEYRRDKRQRRTVTYLVNADGTLEEKLDRAEQRKLKQLQKLRNGVEQLTGIVLE
jgi:hypothetical protein